jgi:methylated-DNA-[protein]-cysteine S-methyltransferase
MLLGTKREQGVEEVWKLKQNFHADKVVSYWIEPVPKDHLEYQLFTAVCDEGLVMSGLGRGSSDMERHLEALTVLAKRYLPGYQIVADRMANLEIIQEIREYLEGKRREFTFGLYPQGTAFQLRVWQELRKIPYGETRSYSEIAMKSNV